MLKIQKGSALYKIRSKINSKMIIRLFMYVFLCDLAFVFLYPFLYMLVTSIKSPTDILDVTIHWLPNTIYGKNYGLSWVFLEYPKRLIYTIGVVSLCTFGHLFSCAFVGYGFARFHFKGKTPLFLLLLLSIIVPTSTIITPMYMLFAKIKLAESIVPIILPTFFGVGLKGGLFIFIFRQFYLSLPSSLEEAAAIDGCGPVRTFFKIAFPSSKSSIMVCVVLSIVWHWNDYFEPLVYIKSESDKLLPMILPGLYSIMKNSGVTDIAGGNLSTIYTEAVAMAATVLVVMPIFILYMILQRQFIQGVERSGITGE